MRGALICSLPAVLLLSCGPAPVDLDAEQRAIRAQTDAWAAAAAARDVEKVVGFWTEDATLMPPDMPALKGREAIRAYVAGAFQIPGFSVTFKSEEVEVSSDGKMAWELASNRFTMPDSAGVSRVTEGKAVVVWRKDPDGQWRARIDIWNGVVPTRAR